MLTNHVITLKFALVGISLVLSLCCYIIAAQISLLQQDDSWNPLRNRINKIMESKFVVNYFARTYIFYLWLFAIGDDKKLLRRFKIIFRSSLFISICSLFYRIGILFFPFLLNPWILAILGIIFVLNGLFRVCIRAGMHSDELIRSTSHTMPKKKIQIIAEKIELANYYSYLSLNTEKSLGQMRLARQVNKPNAREDLSISLDRQTLPLYHTYQTIMMNCMFISMLVLYFSVGYYATLNFADREERILRETEELELKKTLEKEKYK